MHMFTRKTEPAAHAKESARPSVVPGPSNRTFMPTPSGARLSRGVSIKGSVKFLNELLIDGEVEGTIDSTGTLTIGEHGRIRGEIRTSRFLESRIEHRHHSSNISVDSAMLSSRR